MGKAIGDWHKFTSLIVSQVSSRQYMQLCVQCSLMTVPFPSLYASPRLFHSKRRGDGPAMYIWTGIEPMEMRRSWGT